MAERYEIKVNGEKVCTDELRMLPPVGGCVVLPNGQEVEVTRIVYPVSRRIVLECKSDTPVAAKEEPAQDVAEAKPESVAPAKNLVDTRRSRR